jgi:hypothetical protein
VDELLTEQGTVPLDWPHIARQAFLDIQSVPPDFMEQGYWLDQNSIDQISGANFNLESLRQTLPEDLRSSLSWAKDKQFYFLFSVLPPQPDEPMEESEAESAGVDEATGYSRFLDAEIPQKLTRLEIVVLIRARNSAVAVWLWRKYAADTRLRENPILLEPWCGVMGLEVEIPPDGNDEPAPIT